MAGKWLSSDLAGHIIWNTRKADRIIRCLAATAPDKSRTSHRTLERSRAAFIPASMGSEVEDLREHAERCRRLARIVKDERNQRLLLELAEKLDGEADKLARKY